MPGEFVSLIGPSGCGKTTLMRIVADLEQPTEGTVTVNNVSPREARLKRAYGYIFQAPALYPWRNVQRNVELPHEIMGVPKEEREAKARRYLELVGLKGFEKKFPWQLSGGMQQRVSIARALSFDPQSAADGRAVRRARRDHPRPHERGAAADLGKDPQDGDLRHPLDRRGGAALDQDRGHERAARAASST